MRVVQSCERPHNGVVTDQPARDDAAGIDKPDAEPVGNDDDRIPDESTLVGAEGVEEEVLAELARAQAKLSDPSAPDDDPDAKGAQV